MIQINELRIGNLIQEGKIEQIDNSIDEVYYSGDGYYQSNYCCNLNPIMLNEEWLLKFGFSVINESSAGKRYGYVINGVFSSDLTFTFWKTTKEAGKFFRGDLELKSVHQLQNIYFALVNSELQLLEAGI
jgi:hypothetical protein